MKKGLATGIGSLPFSTVNAVDEALDIIFEYVPAIPFWPQLPKRAAEEGMNTQFSEHIPCLKLSGHDLLFCGEEKEKNLEAFYERIISNDIEYFGISKHYAYGLYAFKERLLENPALLERVEYIKCHVTGPFTFAAAIKDEQGVALLHDPVFMQVFIKALTMKALWQIAFFKNFGKKMIIFLDEPFLGCFGSAYTPINRNEVVNGLSEITSAIKSTDVLTGVHCCGNTDWSIFTDIKSLDIINFDAFGFMDKFILYASDLGQYLKRGGILCWGIVPTQSAEGGVTSDMLVRKIREGMDILVKKGIPRGLLAENLLISPSCGLGMLKEVAARAIFKALSETSSLIQKTF